MRGQDDAGVVELVTALRTGRIDLRCALEQLSQRGIVAENEYRAGVETLTRWQEEEVLDARTVVALVTRLDALRGQGAARAHGGRTAAPMDDDATVMAAPAGEDSDALTRVAPVAQPSAHGEVSGPQTQGTGGAAGWEQLADAAGGEVATVGMRLKGRFQLERELGRGGMGVVFLAVDERKVEARDRDPYVAVKVLNDEFRRHPDSLIALQRESRRSQLLAHDNIVRVYDFDKAGTIVFMTMEYIDGHDLRTLIREEAYNGMPLPRARPLIEGMIQALARAHAAGVVHSDFKPGNVMVTRDGVPKVFDFGIARAGKHVASASGEQTVFDASTLGALTPAYASLEMIQGKAPTPSDDIYALGCVCFELLTGKHPFDKVSAEVALREGRVPPPVPGLTRRQYRTLCAAVAFTREQRLQHVQQLREGLREVGLRERLMPLAGYGVAATLALGAGAVGVTRHLHERQVTAIIAGFSDTPGAEYADERQAAAGLAALREDERRAVVREHEALIESFLLRRLDALWNPAAGRYAYAQAMAVFALRDDLRMLAPGLDARREAMPAERSALLHAFDRALAGLIASGDIFDARADGAADTLAKVRAVDPDSALLRHPGLEMAYDAAVARATEAGELGLARTQLDTALAVLPDSLRLQLRAGELAAAQFVAQGASVSGDRAGLRDAGQARALLASRMAEASTQAGWREDVAAALQVLDGDDAPATRALVDALAAAIADEAGAISDPGQVAYGRSLVEFGLRHVPASVPLQQQRDRLQGLHAQLQARLQAESRQAEAAARVESVRHALAAGDLDSAQAALSHLGTLDPAHAFVTGEGPRLMEAAYLRHAQVQFDQGERAGAITLLAGAIAALGERDDLQATRGRYMLADEVLVAEAGGLTPQAHARLRERLDAAYRADALDMTELETRLRQTGQLEQATLRERLELLAPGAAGARVVPRRVAPGNADPVAAPAQDTPAARPDDPLPPVPAGPDPCGASGLVGRGRFCFDTIGAVRGPTLVVVPGIDGGKPFALTRAQVTVAEFNRFCAQTGQCRERSLADPVLGALPVENITLAQGRAYARWLVHATGGWRYRLPTDAEWTHAASAGAQWQQAADSNCIPPAASAGDAAGAPVSARGRDPNPWGLINLTGNVWEWATRGDGVVARGGSFRSYWSECTVQARRPDGGSAQRDVGLRLLRELK